VKRSPVAWLAVPPTATAELAVGTPVVSTVSMRGVPEGTAGKVIHVQGLSWIRYWVWFDNGQRVGTLGRNKLATPIEWERRHDVVTAVAGTAAVAIEGVDAGGGSGDVGGVPGYLLERSKAARARFAAKKG
jgi:hypothetical protein